ncbi:MAG: hypothetical protein CMC91_04935 [Flavobacteriaceae bacterium]|nr:hypothetical protein [Flavobacteriaceae bacterium]|tara:strand:- start:11509 stop:12402 length:894 start_codon:yes stop_codon:yes gene_type:complete
MKTYIKNLNYFFITLLVFFSGCKKDNPDEVEEIRDLSEQTIADNSALIQYLETHFYNYDDFEKNPDKYPIEITLDTIAEDNANKTPLIDQVTKKTIELINGDDKINVDLYYLVSRQGRGVSPSVADSTFVTYKGILLNGVKFDEKVYPVWFDLISVVRGFREVLPELSDGTFSIRADGTFDFKDYGQGILFIPSSLGYYSNNTGSIPAYSPLIFSVSLYLVNQSDHDLDGILSIDEDVNKDNNPLNDDTDNDGIYNLFDTDDDGDGILTSNEYDQNDDGIPDDSDNDGIPDYLDSDQ